MAAIGILKNRILSFFQELGQGIPISVRMFFCFGKEAQVYKMMSNLAKTKSIDRVAWGVYMLPNDDGSMPHEVAIARAKAKGFGKAIYDVDDDIKHNNQTLKIMSGNVLALFATSGASSSFRYGDGKIVFCKIADRKIGLVKRRVGKVFTTFWKLFTRDKSAMDKKLERWQINDRDKSALPRLLELLPMWLKTDLREYYPDFPWKMGLSEALAHCGARPKARNANQREIPRISIFDVHAESWI